MLVRAVDGHVHPTCSKFNVANRFELAYLM